MSGRPKKKCIFLERYTVCPSNYDGKHIYQMKQEELIENSIKISQSYENLYAPYNLLFEVLEIDELYFLNISQTPESIEAMVISTLDLLTPREGSVLKLLYGFENNIRRTFAEVADEFRVSFQRIRQIRDKAIRKLRRPSLKRRLLSICSLSQDINFRGYQYRSHIKELEKTIIQRIKRYSKVVSSEDVYFYTLSAIYPRDILTKYFESDQYSFPWSLWINTEPLRNTLAPSVSLNTALEQAGLATISDVYKYYCKGTLFELLKDSRNVGPVRAKHFVDKCSAYFTNLEQNSNGTSAGNCTLGGVISELEKICVEDKTSIVSPYIPNDYLEILLVLNYRTIEDLISDYKSGELKSRCSHLYKQAVLGDVYDIVSEFLDEFIKKPIEYTRVCLADYEDVPAEIAASLKTKERAKREGGRKAKGDFELFEHSAFDDEDDFELFDFLILDNEDDTIPNVSDLLVVDLDIPLWIKLLLGRAGFVYASDLLSKSVSDLLIIYKLGFTAIKTLCYALDGQGYRLQGCSKDDYPKIKTFIQSVQENIIERTLEEELNKNGFLELDIQQEDRRSVVIVCSVKFRKNGMVYRYIADRDEIVVGDYVLVPVNDYRNAIAKVFGVEYLSPDDPQYYLEQLSNVIAKSNIGDYLCQVKAERDGWKRSEITRKQLYDELWSSSVSALAKKYDISYQQFLTQLKNTKIPIPPKGYHAMSECRKQSEIVPLQGDFDEMVCLMKWAGIDQWENETVMI